MLDDVLAPGAVAGVVKREKELEVLLGSDVEGHGQLGIVGRVVVGHVESEGVDAGGFGEVDLRRPVVHGEVLGVAHLFWSVCQSCSWSGSLYEGVSGNLP